MVRNKDLVSGIFFLAVGTAFAWGSGAYEMGTASFMGPGYYPRLIGLLAMVVGIAVIVVALFTKAEQEDGSSAWAWKELALILSANVVFGISIGGLPSLGLQPLGLAVGIYTLIFVALLASGEFRIREFAILSTVLLIGVYTVCIKVLNLSVPLFPAFVAD
jgi:hypothetical protein